MTEDNKRNTQQPADTLEQSPTQGQPPAQDKQRPFDRVVEGNLSISLWRNRGRYGDYLKSQGVKKTYEDENGNLKETSSLSGVGEHVRATRLMGRASERIEQYREQLKAGQVQNQERERER